MAAVAFDRLRRRSGREVPLDSGIWMLLTVGSAFKSNTIAKRVGRQFSDQLPAINEPIPSAVFLAIAGQVAALLPNVKKPKAVAGVMSGVWEKMHVQPPGLGATVGLMSIYLLAAIFAVPWLLILFRHAPPK